MAQPGPMRAGVAPDLPLPHHDAPGSPDWLDGAGVVVTGGGRGIGRALAVRLAAAGARVVVNDLDAASAGKVAAEIGGFAVPGDAASEDGVTALIADARAHLGEIELFCANAGIAREGGPEATPEAWASSWEVNVMAHVRASRELLPEWLERGRGRYLATVSAAGLLTMLGSAPYSVTKHAALAYAEWLSATYGDRGVVVQALCPQGVNTDMLHVSPVTETLLGAAAIEPEVVAETVVTALADNRFLILPHPEVADYYRRRATDPDRWLAGMRSMARSAGL